MGPLATAVDRGLNTSGADIRLLPVEDAVLRVQRSMEVAKECGQCTNLVITTIATHIRLVATPGTAETIEQGPSNYVKEYKVMLSSPCGTPAEEQSKHQCETMR